MTEKTPIVVYLDSSDYSVLSDPKRPLKVEDTRKRLVELAASPRVLFAFSGIHISEMAPLQPRYTPAASARTDLMVELCNRNTFLSHDTLIKLEIGHLFSRNDAPVDALTQDGTWFPDIGKIITPSQFIDTAAVINETGAEMGLNRKSRRLLKSKASRHGKFRPNFVDGVGGFDLSAVLDRYPMRPQDAQVIANYLQGKATATEADGAFLQSLRDPRWMMRWFHEHSDRLGAIGNWARGPAENLTLGFSKMIDAGNLVIEMEQSHGVDSGVGFLSSARWHAQSEELTVSVVNRLLQSFHPGSPACNDARTINRYCPGISSLVRVALSSLRNSFGPTPRKLARSDFVDAMHAMYAPYCNVFRSDRYMAPIVAGEVEDYGTVVAGTLERVPSAIEGLI